MKRILLPTDFSENAYNAIRYAMHLFKGDSATFYLLNTFTPASYSADFLIENPTLYGLEEVAMMNSKKNIVKTEDSIITEFNNPKHQFERLSIFGMLTSEIKEIIKRENIDLIVMGTKGATGAKEFFLGSNTQDVIKSVDNCPVLAVPEESSFNEVSDIAFATDFERVYFKSEIVPIVNLAKSQDATVRMIHVYDDPKLSNVQRFNSNALEQYFKEINYEFHVISDFSTIEKAIQACVEELEIDMLMMIKYKHSFIERLTREPVIKKMTFHTTIPFLVIPADN